MKRLPRTLLALALAFVLGFAALPFPPASAAGRISGDDEFMDALEEMRDKNAIGFHMSLKKSYYGPCPPAARTVYSRHPLEGTIRHVYKPSVAEYPYKYGCSDRRSQYPLT